MSVNLQHGQPENTVVVTETTPVSAPKPDSLLKSMARAALMTLASMVIIAAILSAGVLICLKLIRPTPEQRAINLVRHSATQIVPTISMRLLQVDTPDQVGMALLPRESLNEVQGWVARESGKRYVVSFTWSEDGMDPGVVRGYWYEVDLEQSLVIPVTGNTSLERKYGLTPNQ